MIEWDNAFPRIGAYASLVVSVDAGTGQMAHFETNDLTLRLLIFKDSIVSA